jgi:predicted porin
MKKSLFAIAAVTAFAGAAQAQSSVTVYGILDVGYIGGNSRVSSSAITTNGGNTKTTVNQFGQGAESTSRLGFKGTEALGNGLSAFFTAEFELFPNDQDLSGNTSAGLKNRQSFVGLQKTGLGKAAVGTQYTPVFTSGAATSPGQFNNVIGDIIYAGAPAVTVKGFDNAGTNSASMTNRTSNTLTVASDKFSGFGVNAMYTLNNQNVSQTSSTAGGNTNANGWGLGADFTYNKFYVTAAYQALKQLTTATNNGNPTLTTSVPWTSAQPANAIPGAAVTGNAMNVNDNQFIAGATYDFGILKAYAQYVSRKATSTQSSNYYVKRSGEQIGVRSFITPTIEAWASAGLGRYTTMGANQPTANMNAWQLGTNYLLSKRTNLYAIYGQQLTSTAAAGTTSGSAGASQYAVGVRHTF